MLSTEMTGNAEDVPGQPKHENSVKSAGKNSCLRCKNSSFLMTSKNLPIVKEKLPDKIDFPRSFEVEQSIKRMNRKIKKVSKFNFTPISDSPV